MRCNLRKAHVQVSQGREPCDQKGFIQTAEKDKQADVEKVDMTKNENKADTLIRRITKATGKSERWVLATLIRSGEYQKIINGEHPAILDRYHDN